MKKFATRTVLLALISATSLPLTAGDATTALFERLDKGDCVPSSLTGVIWTITTGPVGTHGALNWGDRLVFEQTAKASIFNVQTSFAVWKNGEPWESAGGWTGSCARDGELSLYVITGMLELDGCLHELAFGRLDHDDTLGKRIEVIFEHADDEDACADGPGHATRHPGHAHGDPD